MTGCDWPKLDQFFSISKFTTKRKQKILWNLSNINCLTRLFWLTLLIEYLSTFRSWSLVREQGHNSYNCSSRFLMNFIGFRVKLRSPQNKNITCRLLITCETIYVWRLETPQLLSLLSNYFIPTKLQKVSIVDGMVDVEIFVLELFSSAPPQSLPIFLWDQKLLWCSVWTKQHGGREKNWVKHKFQQKLRRESKAVKSDNVSLRVVICYRGEYERAVRSSFVFSVKYFHRKQ